ncbi:MAG: hypothetical protein NC218_12650, partial [Acetobacter sp.]|nr:hypothetical protein [Acetobacter sp.]
MKVKAMLDTVTLVYTCKERLTQANSPFSDFSRNGKGFTQAILRGDTLYRERGLYYPTIRYCERPIGGGLTGTTWELVIEFSIPKLLCDTNLYEFDESSFNLIVETLHERITDMGITFIYKIDIPKLYVRRMDVGKNVLMNSRLEVDSVIHSIGNANVNRHLNFDKVDYVNGGRLVRFHSKDEDITFYDKSKELDRQSVRNEGMVATKLPGVLRFEVKMSGKRMIVQRMKDAGLKIPDAWEFQNLFTNEVCRTLLLKRLEFILGCIPKIPLDDEKNILGLLANIVTEESQ